MMRTPLGAIFAALCEAHVQFLVVGGVAVVLHGHLRFTADLDLVLRLEKENVLRAIRSLATLGFRPRAPVEAELFADPDKRQEWIEQKGLMVFSLWSPQFAGTEIYLFVREPFEFSAALQRALIAEIGELRITVASIEDLIALKTGTGRPQDLADIEALRMIASELGRTS